MKTFIIALRVTLVTLIVTGLLYPLAVTGLAQLIFPHRANGSIATDEKGKEVGSELLGQTFADPGYLHPRPSANGYDAANSGGTNLSTTSKKLREGQPDDPATKDVDESFTGAKDLAAAYRTENQLADNVAVPVDAVTRSASGLDPDISPENALLQAKRIATARGIAVERVQEVIEDHTQGRDLDLFGEPHVNVLEVNLAFDRLFGSRAHVAADGAGTR